MARKFREIDQLDALVDRAAGPGGHWFWKGASFVQGRAVVYVPAAYAANRNSQLQMVVRILKARTGPIPKRLSNSCGDERCINPAHWN